MRQFQLPWICRLILTALLPLSSMRMEPGTRKIFLLSASAPLCSHTAGAVLGEATWRGHSMGRAEGKHRSSCPCLSLALTSLTLAALQKTPQMPNPALPSKIPKLCEKATWEKLQLGACSTGCSGSLGIADPKLASSQTGVCFLWCNLPAPWCPLWDPHGLESNSLSVGVQIRHWLYSVILSQSFANTWHHFSMGFWELCHFALAEDLALCN